MNTAVHKTIFDLIWLPNLVGHPRCLVGSRITKSVLLLTNWQDCFELHDFSHSTNLLQTTEWLVANQFWSSGQSRNASSWMSPYGVLSLLSFDSFPVVVTSPGKYFNFIVKREKKNNNGRLLTLFFLVFECSQCNSITGKFCRLNESRDELPPISNDYLVQILFENNRKKCLSG